MTDEKKDEILRHYIVSAMWSTLDISDLYEYMDERYDIEDMDEETLAGMKTELFEFIDKYYHLVDPTDVNPTMEHFVHDFWLTRNGHGSGYWDGDYKNGEELSKAADEYGAVCLYVGDDNKIYRTD